MMVGMRCGLRAQFSLKPKRGEKAGEEMAG